MNILKNAGQPSWAHPKSNTGNTAEVLKEAIHMLKKTTRYLDAQLEQEKPGL